MGALLKKTYQIRNNFQNVRSGIDINDFMEIWGQLFPFKDDSTSCNFGNIVLGVEINSFIEISWQFFKNLSSCGVQFYIFVV